MRKKLVTELSELEYGYLYKIENGNYFSIAKRGFNWKDNSNKILAITHKGIYSNMNKISKSNTLVSIEYRDGDTISHADIPLNRIQQNINKSKYIKIGRLKENLHRI